MRAPAFWWTPRPGVTARVLEPLGRLYGAATAARMRRPGLRLPVPVICVGNLVAGGAGKTPTALALAAILAEAGGRPAFLSRGYGRAVRPAGGEEPIRVDPATHDASHVGDEPLLLAAVAPTYVAADRLAAARTALDDGATVLILDDGLQNPALAKTAGLAVVDGASGIGNGLCMPAGPLRAPLAAQWPLISAVCVIGGGDAGARVAEAAAGRGLPIWTARLVPDPAVVRQFRGVRLVAFAGIGRPAKFFSTLRDQNLDVAAHESFPDHHRFTPDDLARLRRTAEGHGACLVTTAKDQARLPPHFPATALPVTLAFDDHDRLARWLHAARSS